jgi:hypothetical protein
MSFYPLDFLFSWIYRVNNKGHHMGSKTPLRELGYYWIQDKDKKYEPRIASYTYIEGNRWENGVYVGREREYSWFVGDEEFSDDDITILSERLIPPNKV